jgi:hypothetical protein
MFVSHSKDIISLVPNCRWRLAGMKPRSHYEIRISYPGFCKTQFKTYIVPEALAARLRDAGEIEAAVAAWHQAEAAGTWGAAGAAGLATGAGAGLSGGGVGRKLLDVEKHRFLVDPAGGMGEWCRERSLSLTYHLVLVCTLTRPHPPCFCI